MKRFAEFLYCIGKRRPTKSVLMMMVGTSLSIFLLCVVIVTLVFGGLISKDIYKENTDSVALIERSMYIAFENVNDVLKTTESIIRENRSMLGNGLGKVDQDQLIPLMGKISEIKVFKPYVEEIILYRVGEDYLITSQGTITKTHFFKYAYNSQENNVDFWEEIMSQYYTPTVIPMAQYDEILSYPRTPKRLFVVPKMYLPYKIGVLVFVNEQRMLDFCGLSYDKIDAKINLYDDKGELVLTNFQDIRTSRLEANSLEILQKSPYLIWHSILSRFLYQKWFDFENMILSVEITNVIRMYYILSILILFLVFCSMLYYFYFRATKAGRKIKEAWKAARFPANPWTVDGVVSAIGEAAQTYRNTFFEEDSQRAFMCRSILNRYLHEKNYYLHHKSTIDGLIGDVIQNKIYVLVDIIFIKVKNNRLIPDLQEIESKLHERGIQAVIIPDITRRYSVLCSFSRDNPQENRNHLEVVMNEIIKEYSDILDMLMIQSEFFNDLNSMDNVYKELNSCIGLCRVSDVNCILSGSSLSPGATIYLPNNLKSQITKNLAAGDSEGLKAYFEEILSKNLKENVTYDFFHYVIFNLYNELISIVRNYDIDSWDIGEVERLFGISFKINSDILDIHGVKNALFNVVNLISAQLAVKKINHSNDEILCYIDTNFKEDIYLDKMAKQFGFSTKYFSYYFKREFGLGFNEYITQLRMEEAKVLLRETEFSVNEISEKVGYVNSATFNIAFKKYTSVSPGKYREQNRSGA